MRVVLIAENWPPRIGGIENYLTHIASGLAGESVTVVAPFAKALANKQEPNVTGGIKEVIRKRFFWPLIKPSWLPLFIWVYRWAKVERPQVLLCGKALFEGLIGYYLKRYLGIPYIVCTYAMEIDAWERLPRTRRKLTRVLRAASSVLYINGSMRKTLSGLGVQDRQLVKLTPGVDERFFASVEESALQSVLKRLAVRRPYVFAVARLVPRKGMAVLIEAFAHLDQTRFADVSLVIAGDGPEYESLRRLAQHVFLNSPRGMSRRRQRDRVVFLGHVRDADLPALYQGAVLFALTPIESTAGMEGFGIVYLEAAASARAVVGTRCGGVSEAVIDGTTGLLVKPNSVSVLHTALDYLLTHQHERDEMGRNARERAWHQFRWQQRTAIVERLIRSLNTA